MGLTGFIGVRVYRVSKVYKVYRVSYGSGFPRPPGPWEDLESRTPNAGPHTTKDYCIGAPLRGSTFKAR